MDDDDDFELSKHELAQEEKDYLKAKTRLVDTERKSLEELLRADTARADMYVLEHEGKERANDELKARDFFKYVYRFDMPVTEKSVKECEYTLNQWDRRFPGCAVTIYFTSPGGEVVAGMAFWDFLVEFKSKGHHLTTVSQGMAASMAGILLQAGDVRVIGAESYLLIHQVQASAMGSWGDLTDRMKWLEKVQERILNIFISRSKLTKAAITKRWERTDWWIDSTEALKLGLVDEVR